MSTVTAARPSVKPSKARREFTCTLVDFHLMINGVLYHGCSTVPGEFGAKAFRLVKDGRSDATYDVIRTNEGLVECDCPDYEARHRGLGIGMCKHGKALVALGLIEAPAVQAPALDVAPIVARDPSNAPKPVEPCCPPSEDQPCGACITSADVVAPEIPEPVEDLDVEADDSWGDDDRIGLGPDPDRLTLAEFVEGIATMLRGLGNAAASMVADHVRELAGEVRPVGARSIHEFEDRRIALLMGDGPDAEAVEDPRWSDEPIGW